MPEGQNLSDYWRVDKSTRQSLELLSIIQGAKGAMSLMGGKFAVQWGRGSSYSSPRTSTAALDIGVLDGIPRPYPGKAVDVVIGLAVHEAGHEKWSAPYDKQPEWNSMSDLERKGFADVANILEDAYVDHRLRKMSPALAGYIRTAREKLLTLEFAAEVVKAAALPPNHRDMSSIWAAITLFGVPVPAAMDNRTRDILLKLLNTTQEYLKITGKTRRLQKGYDTWKDIISKLSSPPLPQVLPEPPAASNSGGIGVSTSNPFGNTESPDGEGENGDSKGIDNGKAQEKVEDKQEGADDRPCDKNEDRPDEDDEEQETDIESLKEEPQVEEADKGDFGTGSTEEGEVDGDEIDRKLRENLLKSLQGATSGMPELVNLSSMLQNKTIQELTPDEISALQNAEHNADIMKDMTREGFDRSYTEYESSYDPEGYERVTSSTQDEAKRMRRAFDVLEEVNARWRKGLKQGKLDAHRLAKIGCGKDSAFKHRDYRGRPSTAIALVLDVSSSMSGQMGVVADAASIFSQALKNIRGVWYVAYTYCSEARREVVMTKIASSSKKLALKDVHARGGTPTGLAIASAVLHLKHRHEMRKLVIHFTDGFPDSTSDVNHALKIAEKHHVEVINIPTEYKDTGCKYSNERLIHSISELPEAVMELLKNIIK